MDAALILPPRYLDFARGRPIQMALAHLVLADADYAHWFQMAAKAGAFVIMDNSLIELGHALPAEELAIAAQNCGASEVILPDVFLDGAGTLAATRTALEFPWPPALGLMGVAHGGVRDEWQWCFDQLCSERRITTIGLPKVLDEIWRPGGRLGCVQYLWATDRVVPGKYYHLLGVWTDPVEVMLQAHHTWLRSVDTALPFHAGLAGVRFDAQRGLPSSSTRPRRPHRFFELAAELEPQVQAAVQHNITVLDEWTHWK